MAKKSNKKKSSQSVFLNEDEITFKMKELQKEDAYKLMESNKLRIIAIEMLFEEEDDE
ncbi:MAG: hypothetical protein U9R32_01020 [Bacteroidota bacterium]|nr:hypothetical protein [Bacteroidota bacterium]